jgi:hypothetical protein
MRTVIRFGLNEAKLKVSTWLQGEFWVIEESDVLMGAARQ